MPIQTSCPACSRPLRVPDNLLGKNVKCPGCSETFIASTGEEFRPEPAGPPRADGAETYREERPPRSSRRDDDDDERPIRPARRRLYDDDDDDFDDEDDRPRRRRSYLAPHRGGTILTLGILSIVLLFVCAILGFIGIAAWSMGHSDLRAMREGRMDPEGRGLTVAGYVMGIIGTVLTLLIFALVCVVAASGGFN